MTYEVSEGRDACIASPWIFSYCKMITTQQLQKVKPTYAVLVIVIYIYINKLHDYCFAPIPILSSKYWFLVKHY